MTEFNVGDRVRDADLDVGYVTKVPEGRETKYRVKYDGYPHDMLSGPADYLTLIHRAVPLDSESPCDEGVTVRAEGITPLVLKAKSPLFLVAEGHSADAGRDIEDEEGAV